MKSKRWLYVLLLALIAGTAYIYWNNSTRTKGVLKDFDVQDTAAINKIFLADKNNLSTLLTRQGNKWLVNEKYQAKPHLIENLLNTIKKIKIKAFVHKGAMQEVMKTLAANAIKVEIYQKDKLVKTYFVGPPTQDNLGTYMIIEKSDMPFITYVPGFDGYLTLHYSPNPNEWRDNTIFSYKVNDIKQVKIDYKDAPEKSFILNKVNNKYVLSNSQTIPVNLIDTIGLYLYLKGFEKVVFEKVEPLTNDSIFKSENMFCEFELIDKNNKMTHLNLFKIPLKEPKYDELNRKIEFDIDRFYIKIKGNDQEYFIAQYFVFDKLLRPITYFKSGT